MNTVANPCTKRKPCNRITAYRRNNVAAARAILENPAKHGGDGSPLVEWAREILRKAEAQQ